MTTIKHHPLIEDILDVFTAASPTQAAAAKALRGHMDCLVGSLQEMQRAMAEGAELMHEAARRLEEMAQDSTKATPEAERTTLDVIERMKAGAKS